MNVLKGIIGLIATVAVIAVSATAEESTITSVELKPCYVKNFEDRMQCGSIQRPLDTSQAMSDDNQIDIHFAIIPAIKPSHSSEAVMAFAGGPGQGAIEFAASFARDLRSVRETRDIILVDQRGTGQSHRLQCQSESTMSPFEFDERTISIDQFTRDEAQRCITELNTQLSAFTTVNAAPDFEAVRVALGYQGLHLYGVSYGTRIAQEFSRQFPQSVITTTLDGVVPMQQSLMHIGIAIDDAMQTIFTDCRNNPSCSNVHQDIEVKLKAVVERLEAEPVTLPIRHPRNHKMINFVITPDKLLSTLRMALYSNITRSLIPLVISQAAEQDYSTLIGLMSNSEMMDSMAIGMHNVIVCGEDYPNVSEHDRVLLADYYFGKHMVRGLDLICPIWNITPVAKDFYQPLANDIPTLLLSGGLDPATPPSWAELAMVDMKKARHLVVETATHNVMAQSCAYKLVRQFIDEGSADNLDASCLDKDTRKQFFMNVNGVVAPQLATEG